VTVKQVAHAALIPRSCALYLFHKRFTPMLPSYNALQFNSKEEHLAALYDACLLIVNTYNGSDVLDGVDMGLYTPFQFMKSARNIINQIAEGNIQ
jgi:hypothetical protein